MNKASPCFLMQRPQQRPDALGPRATGASGPRWGSPRSARTFGGELTSKSILSASFYSHTQNPCTLSLVRARTGFPAAGKHLRASVQDTEAFPEDDAQPVIGPVRRSPCLCTPSFSSEGPVLRLLTVVRGVSNPAAAASTIYDLGETDLIPLGLLFFSLSPNQSYQQCFLHF